MMKTPECSIILVSYNNFEFCTAPCIHSLIQEQSNFEIIVIDNNSTSHTRSQLSSLAKSDPRIKVQFNIENRGYAGGNNDGAHIADSDILILLNNDTLVPTGSIMKLISLLHRHPDWDMLGPVTNANGNDQQIFTAGNSPENILSEGKEWCSHSDNYSFRTDLLGFFCVAIRKKAYEQLSGLDETFGLGFYEDTDFCFRAYKAGLHMRITEDVFIFHHGSATFSKNPARVRKLLKRNRKRFKHKHGTLPVTQHTREKNLQALARYRQAYEENMAHTDLHFKAENRLKRAAQLIPKSPLKKLIYTRKLTPLQLFFTSS